MSKFKVGDKVRGIESGVNFSTYDKWISKYAPTYRDKWDDSFPHRQLREGVVGVVVAIGMHESQSYGMLYLVQRDNCKISLIGESGIELVEQPRREFIVIRRDGAKTIAELRHDREVIKSGTAICNASDTFDFDTGAKLAFDRLMGREEPKPTTQPAPRFKVGDRVVTLFGSGTVVEINRQYTLIAYTVEHDNASDQLHSGQWDIGRSRTFSPNRCYFFSELGLSPAPEPKYYTGKVVCISGNYKVGKIYTVVNGLFNEVEFNRSVGTPYTSVDDMNSTFCFGKFAEVKE